MATIEEISAALEHPFVLLIIGSGVLGMAVALLTHFLEGRRKKREIEVERNRKEMEIKVEDSKKKLEIKVELVSKMSEVIGNVLGSAKTAIIRSSEELSDAEGEKVMENIEKWFKEVNIIRSKLKSYYGDTDLAKRWFDYQAVLIEYYLASINYFSIAPEPDPVKGGVPVIPPEPVKAPEPDPVKGGVPMETLKDQLKMISDYFSQNVKWEILDHGKPITPWENLPMKYNESQWADVYQVFMLMGDKIIEDVLKLHIKVF